MVTFKFRNNISYDVNKKTFNFDTDKSDILRYLKGLYRSKAAFQANYVDPQRKDPLANEIMDFFIDEYDNVQPYSYKEAFAIENAEYRAMVFGSINISEMMENLGKELIKVDGKHVVREIYSPSGEFLGTNEYDNVYETYSVSGKELGINNALFVVKCWCTSTNKEHWLWIEEKYKDDPLAAIASTFRIHENLKQHIKSIKRQGDLMFLEMGDADVTPSGDIVPLTKEEYFGWLVAES